METSHCCSWILACVVFVTQGQFGYSVKAVTSGFSSELPCPGLQTNVLFQTTNVVACSATWKDHIDAADGLCYNGWHVCSWNDTEVLSHITWYQAKHVSGCYVINAAHDGTTCRACQEKKMEGEMAAIGADCVSSDHTSNSCFGRGRIDGSFSAVPQYTPCHHAPWITGVLCCKDRTTERKPEIMSSPEPFMNVAVGSTVELRCKAEGEPSPTYQWFKNGETVQISGEDTLGDGGLLRIAAASSDDAGFYQCLARNSHGAATSYKSQLRVTERVLKDIAVGCRDPTQGKVLDSADVAVCDGKWQGHVKRASKRLCARGWRVCSMDDMRTLYSASWNDVNESITGCYAYNAATSQFFPCSKCKPRQKGNKMSGIGGGCGNIVEEGYSCLRQGRIDVHSYGSRANVTAGTRAKKSINSCRYTEGVTTGVVCCKYRRTKTKQRQEKQRKPTCKCMNGGTCNRRQRCRCKPGFGGALCQQRVKLRCTKSCREHSFCNVRGKCVCSRGFRRLNGTCVKKGADGETAPPAKTCSPLFCLHGGVCENGQCKCKRGYRGVRCQQEAIIPVQ